MRNWGNLWNSFEFIR